MKKSIALLFAASTLFLAGCCTTHEHAAVKWEYTVYTCSGLAGVSDPNLSHLGAQGWKLVDVVHATDTKETQYVFQRATK
jgi:hypothetical protein